MVKMENNLTDNNFSQLSQFMDKYCGGLSGNNHLRWCFVEETCYGKCFRQVDGHLKSLFQNLNETNKFKLFSKRELTDEQLNCTLEYTNVDNDESSLETMSNYEFLQRYIDFIANEKKPQLKTDRREFVRDLALILLGLCVFIEGIKDRDKQKIFIGILNICAYAVLICSLVFHLSLGVLIPSSIILGLITIAFLVLRSLAYIINKSDYDQHITSLDQDVSTVKDILTQEKDNQKKCLPTDDLQNNENENEYEDKKPVNSDSKDDPSL